MDLEDIMLSERSQTEKGKYSTIPLFEISKIDKSIERKVDDWWLPVCARRRGTGSS